MALVAIDLTGQTRFGDMTLAGGNAAAFDGVNNQASASCAQKSITNVAAGCFVGTRLASTKVIGQVKLYGSNNAGYCVVNPNITLAVYGKAGSDPANSSDGILLATTTFADTANEAAARTLTVTDTGAYDRVWCKLNQDTATARICAIAEIELWEIAVTGNLVVTEPAGDDTAAFDADLIVTGSLVTSESSSPDTAAFDGDVIVTGNLVTSEVGDDTASFTGVVFDTGPPLLIGESDGFCVDFLGTNPAKRVAVKVSGVATEYAVDDFFTNVAANPKQVYDITGTLVWSPHNFCLRSQEFNQTTPWNPTTTLTVVADAITAPDGTLTADRIVETATSGNHQLIHSSITQIAGATYTISVYAKAGERNWLAIEPANRSASNFFDLTNGVVGNHVDTCAIQSVGSGWYRCSVTYVNTVTGGPTFLLRTANGQVSVYTGDVTKGLYLWGAQMERGPVATTYFPSTTIGRFSLALDYDPISHVPKGMLCETAATNIYKWSKDLSNAVWVTDSSCTITLNAAVAPNGRMEAAKFAGITGWGWWYIYQVTAATAGRVSIYVKSAGHRYFYIQDYQAGLTDTFDLDNGTVIPTDPSWSPPIGGATIQAVGDGWYRCSSKMSAASIEPSFYGSSTVDGSIENDGVSGIYLWSPQLETGLVATTPIETFAVSVARAVDVPAFLTASINYSATAGSWWLENSINILLNGRMLGNSGAVGFIWHNGSNSYLIFDGSGPAKATTTSLLGNIHRVASAYKSADRAITVDGQTAATDTGTVTNLLAPGTTLYFGYNGSGAVNAYFRRAFYVPRRMTNTELQTKTIPDNYARIAAPETGSDTAAFTGTVSGTGALPINGDMAAVETGSDTAAFDGDVIVSGSLAVTEVGADVAAFTGKVVVNGALAATEAATPDVAAFSGAVAVSGTLAATEVGTDTAAFTGTLGLLGINGSMAVTETGSDTAAFSGKVTITSNLAATETGVDTAAFTGKVIVTGDFAASEIGVDLAAFSGKLIVTGSLVTTEVGADVADFSGVVPIRGTLSATEVGNDTASFTGVVGSIIGSMDAVEAFEGDTAHFFGTVPKTSTKPEYRLLNTAVSSGAWISVIGGGYVWSITCDDFNGAICMLQAKGADGETPMRVAVATTNSMIPINIGELTEMRVQVYGRIFNGWSDLKSFDVRTKFTHKLAPVPKGCETVKQITSGILVTIRPSKTDARIQNVVVGDAHSLGDHVIGFPKNPNGELWIHFNGHGAKPYLPNVKRYLCEVWGGEVMAHGYTFIDLAYMNDISVNEICSQPIGQNTDNAAGDMRREIITGEQVSPLQTVNVANSIVNRVKALLDYVDKNNLPVPDVRPFDWPKVYISGHSQGGGHTYYIAKHWGCKYATHLAGPYDLPDFINPHPENIADWYYEPINATPKERMGAFLTTHDQSYNAFTGSYDFLGWPKNEMWFELDNKYYIDDKGKLVNGHAAALQAPIGKDGRAKASFERIALLP